MTPNTEFVYNSKLSNNLYRKAALLNCYFKYRNWWNTIGYKQFNTHRAHIIMQMHYEQRYGW